MHLWFSQLQYYADFSKKWFLTSRIIRVSLRPNFRVNFFFQINFKGITYYIQLRALSIFWWTFFLVRFIFKVISFVKMKAVTFFRWKLRICLNLIYEIPWKMNRTKKKVHQKIELIFSFTKEIPLKIIRNKKKSTMKLGLKNTL